MPSQLRSLIFTALLGVGSLVAACSDEPSDETLPGEAGSAGSSAGKTAGGASGSAGKTNGGQANAGTAAQQGGAGAGGEGLGGAAGLGGSDAEAGAATGGVPAEGGAAGAAGAPTLDYVCGTTTLSHKLCSALAAADCADSTICADCVPTRQLEREAFANCPACAAHDDAFYQCPVDAFEAGNLASGVECIDGFGADMNEACLAHLDEAIACSNYAEVNGCPATWPMN